MPYWRANGQLQRKLHTLELRVLVKW